MSYTRATGIGLAIAGLALALGAEAGAEVERFSDRITVTEVEIPVRVLDGGNPVRGLTAADFVVLDDGAPREIVGFSVLDLAEADEVSPSVRDSAGAPEGRWFLLLFDFLYADLQHQARAVGGARRMIAEQLHRADRVAVAYLSGTRGAQVLLGFSDDHRRVAAALDLVESMIDRDPERFQRRWAELQRLRRESVEGEGEESRELLNSLVKEVGAEAALSWSGGIPAVGDPFSTGWGRGGSPVAGGFGRGQVGIDPVVASVAPQAPEQIAQNLASGPEMSAIRFFSRELDQLATWLRGVPGQKHLIYFSQGFGPWVLESHQAGNHLERMLESMRRNGWTLHSVDLDGIPDPFSGPAFSAGDLFYLANETGGDLMENFNRIHEATESIVHRTSVIYLLTVQPTLAPDGRYHRLEVGLANRDRQLRVVHRPGYYAPKPHFARDPLERRLDAAALLLGEAELMELEARVLVVPLSGSSEGATVPVVVEVDGRGLEATGKRPRLDFEIHAFALDAEGNILDLLAQSLRIGGRQARTVTPDGGLRFLGSLELPPGEHRIRVLVRAGERVALGTHKVTVPVGGVAEGLLAPLFVRRAPNWLVVREELRPGAMSDRPETGLFLQAGLTAVPAVSPRLDVDETVDFVFVLPAGSSDRRVAARILDHEGRLVEGGEVVFLGRRPAAGGGIVVAGRLTASGLLPGAYQVEVSLAAEQGQRSSSSPFRVSS